MKAELKKQWCAALRGEGIFIAKYVQGRDRLRSANDEFCCLGVLCDIVKPDGWGMYNKGEEGVSGVTFFSENDESTTIIPRDLREQLGIDESEMDALSIKNDHGVSFASIANWIEENIKED